MTTFRPLDSPEAIAEAVEGLVALIPAFAPVVEKAGAIPMRYQAPGYTGLARNIVAQMVSRAATEAIWTRLEALTGTVTPEAIIAQPAEALRAAGLSGAKEATLRRLAIACVDGLDLAATADLPAEQAIRQLTAIKGIGPWTAEVYLLFAAGHPDIFPVGDVALQNAATHALGLSARPTVRAFRDLTLAWRPRRSIAARILWAYYASAMRREATPVALGTQG